MLHILTGRAGSGKTKEVFRRMARQGVDRPQILLVPEQASFETEQRFCRETENRGGRYGEVLTFSRLENRVLSLAGGGARPVLDEGGRLLVMYAALRSVSAHLSVYAMPSRKPEFLNSLIATADELKSCCVTGEDLLRAGEETDGLDGEKLKDLGLILGAYEAMTARGSLDPRDRLTRLADKLGEFPYCRGKDLWLDGFTDFTPQQGLVLERLLRQADTITVTLTMEPGREEPFALARRTAVWLKRLAAKASCPVKEEYLADAALGRTEPLRHLEANLFAFPMERYDGPWDGSVTVTSLPTPRDEVRWAAGVIRELAREGYRYRDIVLTARSIDRYQDHIREVFSEFDIPVFQAEKTDILKKPVFTLILAALDTISGGYEYEDIFRYLKTGLAGVTADQCDKLENYVRTWDLWGSRWTAARDWTMHPAGYHRSFSQEDRALLAELNALRRQVTEPLERLRKSAGDTIRSQGMALYAFLEEIGAPEALEARAAALLEEGEPELSGEYSQLWDIFCGALEQCVALLGEMEGSFSDFSRLLKLLFSRYAVGSIPASLDRVTAGDAHRLANRSGKILILLGADDGSIPRITPEQGLLTDRDREVLEGFGLDVAPRAEETLSRENIIVYAACTQPTDRLYVSWPAAADGEKRPSFLAERLTTIFPRSRSSAELPLSRDRLITLAARDPKARIALEASYGEAFRRLDRAAGWQRGRLSAAAVRRLYGEKVAMSASRMDRYKSCHFAYFLQYGLEARPRRRAGFDAPEYGTLIHYVLEHVLKAAREKGGVKQCTDDEIRKMTRQAVDGYVNTHLGGMEHQTPRFRYLFRRLQAGIRGIVDNVIDELRSSDFQPVLFELGFGSGQDLPPVELRANGVTLRVSGFVDRVDGWEKDGRLYVRVVDYKTGRKSFDLTEVWNGLGLQMLLYLFTLEEKGARLFGKSPDPAGVLYLPARDAMISGSRSMDEAERRALLDKELVRRGLILEDEEVVRAMEHGEHGLRFLPLKVSARTGAITGDALVTAERLGRLRRHTRRILEDICREIASGNIDADPFWRGPAKNACQYCEYVQVCQFEEGRDRRRWAPALRASEFWEALEEGGEDHDRSADA